MRYRALVDLFYPSSQAMLRRLERENVPLRKRGMKHVKAGAIVTDIPAVSIPVLLKKGKIEEVDDGPTRLP